MADFAAVHHEHDLREADDRLFPGILKVARFGYDGKGQAVVVNSRRGAHRFPAVQGRDLRPRAEARARLRSLGGPGARRNGSARAFRPPRTATARASSTSPWYRRVRRRNCTSEAAGTRRQDRRSPRLYRHPGRRVLRRARPAGDQRNGAAAAQQRPLHASTPASPASIEQQVRALCGLPLGEARAHSAAAMVNLLGDLWYETTPPATTTASRTGRSCTPFPTSSCTFMASITPGPAARWDTSPCSMPTRKMPGRSR
jgi:5-(carboxyamino)imidazole ribonucleotide synthase